MTLMTLSKEQLSDIARRYYPALGDALYRLSPEEYDALINAAPETRRRLALCRSMMADRSEWKVFVRALANAFPHYPLLDTPRPPDCCHSVRMRLPPTAAGSDARETGKELVVCSSFLAPIYLIYESHDCPPESIGEPEGRLVWQISAESEQIAAFVAREMAARFGQERLDPDLAQARIPGIEVGNLLPGQATIRDAFFSDELD